MDANYIKAALISNIRFKRQCYIVATEAGVYSSDVIFIDRKGFLNEVEVKVSYTDFKADFKKRKHHIYTTRPDSLFVPTYFYFCVPDDNKELINKIQQDILTTKYGLLTVSSDTFVKKRIYKSQSNVAWLERMKMKVIEDDGKYLYYFQETKKFCEKVKVLKRAKKIKEVVAVSQEIREVTARMSSEIANLRTNNVRRDINEKRNS